MKERTKKMTTLAMLAAAAYLVMVVGRIPILPAVEFLKYDPKDIVIVIAGFLFGPFACVLISFLVSFLEMLTVSGTGYWGMMMNILSTCSFVCTAAWIYRKKRTQMGATIGLVVGVLVMSAVMLLWDYFIIPIYMGVSRDIVAAMLLPSLLPFNLIKGGLNAALTLVLYKPVVTALRRARLVPASTSSGKKGSIGVLLVSLLVVASAVLLILVLRGVI